MSAESAASAVETAVVLCGGRGTRLDRLAAEKPLVEVGGTPMVERVVSALRESSIASIVAATSPHAPATARFVSEMREVDVVETDGDGYVSDLDSVLTTIETPVLTVAADLPLLGARHVESVLATAPPRSTTVCVPAARKCELGVSVDTAFTPMGYDEPLSPSGVNVVAEIGEETIVRTEPAFAVNVNRPRDLWIAAALSADG
ncbi:MAG: NTP transferase domain-containing protein [Halobacteriota archaeon]